MSQSGIRRLFDMAREMPGCVDLSIGQADFDVPDPIKEATIAAIREGCGRYSSTDGYHDVVGATHEHLRDHYGLAEHEEVMMTSGASGALTLAMLTLLGPGDEVLLPDPEFVVYGNLAKIAGATATHYDLYPDFRLRPERLEEAITERTRVVLLNSPANPTGSCLTVDEVAAVVEICDRHNVVLISDELYRLFVYEGEHISIKRFAGDRSLLIGGVSKSFGMAGWRLGWAAGNPEIIDRMRTLQQFTFTCPPTLVQRGALAAFGIDMSHEVEAYRRKRDILWEGLVAAGYDVVKPAGSFFMFPRVPWGNDSEFSTAALNKGLVIVPGSAFSRRDTHFRASFAAPDDVLRRGVEILAELATPPVQPSAGRTSISASSVSQP